MNNETGKRSALTATVIALATTLTVLAVAMIALVVDHPADLPMDLPVWVPFLGLLLAGIAPLTLEVQSSTFSISLTEVPIVICLVSVQRIPMAVAGTAGCLAAMLLHRKGATLKVAFNTAVALFEIAVTAAVFDRLISAPSLTDWRTWLAAIAATSAASGLSSVSVNIVISVAGDRISLDQAIRHSALGMVNAATASTLTLLALMTLDLTIMAAIPLAFLAAISLLPLRRHATLQRRYNGLLLLHEFTAGLTGSSDLAATLASVLVETCGVLRAENASIALRRDGVPFVQSLRSPDEFAIAFDDEIWKAVVDGGRTVCIPRGSTAFNSYLERHKMRDLVAVPLINGETVIGALMAQDRLGATSTFDADDLSIFGTMANQTTMTLENLRLIDRLRDESAEREHQALHDELTGLPNRAHLYATLEARIDEGPLAVAMLDLDRFKEVNDTLGHHSGDVVLKQAAQRLKEALPPTTLIARLGGDEFAIVLFDESRIEDAHAKLTTLEQAFSEPFELDSISLRVDASIGLAMSPDHGNDRGSLLRRADVAMYAAKQFRGTTVRSYDRSQEQSSMRSLEIVGELRKAIENDSLSIVFQPKAELATSEVVGAEALARWNHPVLGNVFPDEFIPLAEQSGLIDGLTRLILRRSLAACADWRANGFPLHVAVNLDAQTLLSPKFLERTLASLAEWQLPPTCLTLEITERELVRELDSASLVIERMRSAGIAMSIDDFGTGYSSLAYLARLPVDEVKIDRAFVVQVIQSPVHEAIIRAISDISNKLGATTVVEGIEDEETWNVVASLGCTYAQGYFLARPMPEEQFLAWLQARRASLPLVGTGTRSHRNIAKAG